jgi:hypothetical protein
MVISQLFIFTLVGVIFSMTFPFLVVLVYDAGTITESVEQIIVEIGGKKSFNDIIDNLHSTPSTLTFEDLFNKVSQPFPIRLTEPTVSPDELFLPIIHG